MILILFLFTPGIGLLAQWHVIHTPARDHASEAVWLKVAKKLRHQIERRKSWHKGHRQHPLTASRWSGVPVATRV